MSYLWAINASVCQTHQNHQRADGRDTKTKHFTYQLDDWNHMHPWNKDRASPCVDWQILSPPAAKCPSKQSLSHVGYEFDESHQRDHHYCEETGTHVVIDSMR